MQVKPGRPATVDEYISWFPPQIQSILQRIREVIQETAPGAVEKISYNMPSFSLNGGLVWFAANKKHIGFYPRPSAGDELGREVAAYGGTKGSVHFPLDKPVPYELIRKIVLFRVKENQNKNHR